MTRPPLGFTKFPSMRCDRALETWSRRQGPPVLVLHGRSGSGKTTALRSLSRSLVLARAVVREETVSTFTEAMIEQMRHHSPPLPSFEPMPTHLILEHAEDLCDRPNTIWVMLEALLYLGELGCRTVLTVTNMPPNSARVLRDLRDAAMNRRLSGRGPAH